MSGSDSWRANIRFGCLGRLLSLSRYCGARLVSSPADLGIKASTRRGASRGRKSTEGWNWTNEQVAVIGND
jgi:hypothetical protein